MEIGLNKDIDKELKLKQEEYKKLSSKIESMLLKQVFCLDSLKKRLKKSAENLELNKSEIYEETYNSGLYALSPGLINPILEKIDFITEMLKGVYTSDLGFNELQASIDNPELEHKISKFKRALEDEK